MELGDVYRTGFGKHWRIIVNDPAMYPEQVVSFSITSCRNPRHDDPSCLLFPSDHRIIDHDSFIAYQFGRIDMNRNLDTKLSSGQIQIEDIRASAELISRILHGAAESERTPFDVFDTLDAQDVLPKP